MFYDDHNPPHFHTEYQGFEGLFEIQNYGVDKRRLAQTCKSIGTGVGVGASCRIVEN